MQRVLLTPSGARRCKVAVPWRFGYVTSETPEVSRSTAARSFGGGVGIGGDSGLGVNASADEGNSSLPKDSNFIHPDDHEGLEKKAVATEAVEADQPSNNSQGSGVDGAAAGKSNSAGKDFMSEVSRSTVAGGGPRASWSDGGLGDEELQSDIGIGGKVPKGGGVGIGDRGLGSAGDAAANEGNSLHKDGNFIHSDEGVENNAAAAEPVGVDQPSDNLQGFQFNGAADKNNPSNKDFVSEGFIQTGDGCRKGRKAVVPWRFGYKDKLMCASENASLATDGSKQQCAPAEAAKTRLSRVKTSADRPPIVKASAGRKRSSVEVQKETGPVAKKRKTYKKRKTNKGSRRQAVPNRRTRLVTDVMTTLMEFRIIYKKLLEEEEAKWRAGGRNGPIRPHVAAFNVYKERYRAEGADRGYVGSIRGIRIGTVFNSSMELSIVGLHRPLLAPVDYISKNKKDGTSVAVSIVSYTTASASNNGLDLLLYMGSMAATGDQNIEATDLALKHSKDLGTPVRVIYAVLNEPGDNIARSQPFTSYVYGGLYLVEKLCIEKVSEDQCVNTFQLRRMAWQKHIDISDVLKTSSTEPFDGIFVGDISGGLEKVPISAINTKSNEYPMALQYMSKIQYPLKHQPSPPSGCDCVGGCSLSKKCACAAKNGGMFPFSRMGLLDDRPLIYECGPSCKCPPTCCNRVSQHGMKLRLQVFKTDVMGWGVRCLDSIPSGSFVCEYVGELLEDQEAQERTSDEYLFAAGHNYHDVSRWKGLCKKIPSLQNGPSEDGEIVFTFDAVNRGNFARFINHSCSPNLFPQNVLYDHDDKRMPHIMFFAGDDIPPLKELSYDCNYAEDAVHDADGNIKEKVCFCGSDECRKRLY